MKTKKYLLMIMVTLTVLMLGVSAINLFGDGTTGKGTGEEITNRPVTKPVTYNDVNELEKLQHIVKQVKDLKPEEAILMRTVDDVDCSIYGAGWEPFTFSVVTGWNMVSLPSRSPTTTTELPAIPVSYIAPVFGYDTLTGAYQTHTTLSSLEGDFLLSTSVQTTELCKNCEGAWYSFPYQTGWNLIPGPCCELPTSVLDDHFVRGIYEYTPSGTPVRPLTLKPGKAYWAFSNVPGNVSIELDCDAEEEASLICNLEIFRATPGIEYSEMQLFSDDSIDGTMTNEHSEDIMIHDIRCDYVDYDTYSPFETPLTVMSTLESREISSILGHNIRDCEDETIYGYYNFESDESIGLTSSRYMAVNYSCEEELTATCDVLDEWVTIRFSLGEDELLWTGREIDSTVVNGVTVEVENIDQNIGTTEPCGECPVLDEWVTLSFTVPEGTATWTSREGDSTVVSNVTVEIVSINETLTHALPCDTDDCDGELYELGDTITTDGFYTARLVDISRTAGIDRVQNAVIQISPSTSGTEWYSITPGEEETISINRNDYCYKVCETTYGHELFQRWANIQVTEGECATEDDDCDGDIIELRETLPLFDWIMLTDIGVAEGRDSHHDAIFDIIHRYTDHIEDSVSITPGYSETVTNPVTDEEYCLHVCETTYGYELFARWAEAYVTRGACDFEDTCEGEIINLRETLPSDDNIMLVDIGIATGIDLHHDAIFDLLGSDGIRYDSVSITPGEEETIISTSGHDLCLHVCETTYGYELFQRWAEAYVTRGECETSDDCYGHVYHIDDTIIINGDETLSLIDIEFGESTRDAILYNGMASEAYAITIGEDEQVIVGGNEYCIHGCEVTYGYEMFSMWTELQINEGEC